MDYQLQFIAKFTNSLPFLNKFHGQDDRLPPAAVCDHNPQSSPYCAICLSDICGGDSYRKLPDCRHCFHALCIDPWLKSHSTCPLCRSQLPQMISLNDNHFDIIANILLLIQNFVEKMCNPLNDELASMLCGGSRI